MALKTKANNKSGGDFELPPSGTHAAVCVAVIELGTHTNEYQGKATDQQKVFLVFELVDENKADGSSHFVGRDFSLSLGKKSNLRKIMAGWRGKDFDDDEELDLAKVVGRPCIVSISHKTPGERTYATLDSVSQPMKGQSIGKPSVTPFAWEITEDRGEPPTEDWLPFIYGKSVYDTINASHEYTGKKSKGGAKSVESNDPADDPF